MLILSVSSSTTASSAATTSPTFFSHLPTVASGTLWPSDGTLISSGISPPPAYVSAVARSAAAISSASGM